MEVKGLDKHAIIEVLKKEGLINQEETAVVDVAYEKQKKQDMETKQTQYNKYEDLTYLFNLRHEEISDVRSSQTNFSTKVKSCLISPRIFYVHNNNLYEQRYGVEVVNHGQQTDGTASIHAIMSVELHELFRSMFGDLLTEPCHGSATCFRVTSKQVLNLLIGPSGASSSEFMDVLKKYIDYKERGGPKPEPIQSPVVEKEQSMKSKETESTQAYSLVSILRTGKTSHPDVATSTWFEFVVSTPAHGDVECRAETCGLENGKTWVTVFAQVHGLDIPAIVQVLKEHQLVDEGVFVNRQRVNNANVVPNQINHVEIANKFHDLYNSFIEAFDASNGSVAHETLLSRSLSEYIDALNELDSEMRERMSVPNRCDPSPSHQSPVPKQPAEEHAPDYSRAWLRNYPR